MTRRAPSQPQVRSDLAGNDLVTARSGSSLFRLDGGNVCKGQSACRTFSLVTASVRAAS